MNRLFSRFRNSLALKVIVSTVVLSLGVIYVAGSALNSQLSAGIKKVNLESSLTEARSTIFSAKYRLVLAQGEKEEAVRKVIDDVISDRQQSADKNLVAFGAFGKPSVRTLFNKRVIYPLVHLGII